MCNAAMLQECKQRSCSMFSVYAPARRRVYASPHIAFGSKSLFVSSLLQSRFFYDAASWSALSSASTTVLRNAYMAPLRTISGMTNVTAEKHSNANVLNKCKKVRVLDHVSLARLRYLPSLMNHASDVHVRLVLLQHKVKNSWINLVRADLVYMWNSIQVLYEDLPDPNANMFVWFSYVSVNLPKWKTI